MPLPFQRRKVDVGNASDLDVVQSQIPLDVNRAAPLVELGSAEIACFMVQSDAQLRASSGLGEFDVQVIAVDGFLKQLKCPLGTKPCFNRMIALTKPIH